MSDRGMLRNYIYRDCEVGMFDGGNVLDVHLGFFEQPAARRRDSPSMPLLKQNSSASSNSPSI